MTGALKRIWNEKVVARFKELFHDLPEPVLETQDLSHVQQVDYCDFNQGVISTLAGIIKKFITFLWRN
jgi:hypothetical protein